MKTQAKPAHSMTAATIKASSLASDGVLVARQPSNVYSVRFYVRFNHGVFIVKNVDQGSTTTWATLSEVKSFINCHK